MNSQSYLVLNAWLQKADSNYIAGRLLWNQVLVVGASNLLWLSCEQLAKIVLLQAEIAAGCADLDEIHGLVDRAGKRLGHNVDQLVVALNKLHPEVGISNYRDVLEKLYEYFFRRYPVRDGSSISLEIISRADELYFRLRSLVLPEIGVGTIDEIYIQRKHGWPHPIPAFRFAYSGNASFAPRQHKLYRITGSDGQVYEECGI